MTFASNVLLLVAAGFAWAAINLWSNLVAQVGQQVFGKRMGVIAASFIMAVLVTLLLAAFLVALRLNVKAFVEQ
ncbi:Hypothetical protein UVM_LOCUS382 [uncultured virus]|nr:Hypothetical protein UVM_LOCUS382 [uncultured virus]